MTIGELTSRSPKALVGRRHTADSPFPLCSRLFGSGARQPLCVFRDATHARPEAVAVNSRFWYLLESVDDARVIAGIDPRVTQLQFRQRLDTPALLDLLQCFPARPGDAYFIPSGRVHGLIGDNLVWEVAESAAEPIAVSGWSTDTAPSPLEQETALDCVRFRDRQLARICGEASRRAYTHKVPILPFCPQFVVDEIRLTDLLVDRTTGGSFHLLGALRGTVEVRGDGFAEALVQGEICCIPATLGEYSLHAERGPATVLRVAKPDS
jgi:mannose-6-phosphate isomerase